MSVLRVLGPRGGGNGVSGATPPMVIGHKVAALWSDKNELPYLEELSRSMIAHRQPLITS